MICEQVNRGPALLKIKAEQKMCRERKSFPILVFVTAIVLLCIVYSPFVKADEGLVELAKRIRPAVVLIETFGKDKNPLCLGTGFFIDKKGSLITNYHVLKGAYSAEVKTFDKRVYPVKLVLAESKELDLIKVSVDIPEKVVQFVQVVTTIPEVAEQVLVVGSPLGLEQTVSEGIVSAVRDIPTIGKIFQISAPISPGSSGSPVVNMRGQVIGVATLQSVEGQNLNFAVSGEQVLALKSKEKGKTLTEWASGISKKKIEMMKPWFEGLGLLWDGKLEEAMEFFKKITEENNCSQEGWVMVGLCCQLLRHDDEAIEALKQAIRIDPNFVNAHVGLALLYTKLGRYDEAIQAYQQVIHIKPDDSDAYVGLGLAYSELGRYQEAIEAYNQAIRIKPDDAYAHSFLGGDYIKLGRYQEAIKALKVVIKKRPDDFEAYYNLGVAYGKLEGREREQIQAYEQAVRIRPDGNASVYFLLGISRTGLGRYTEAIEAFQQSIRIDPNNAKVYYFLGGSYNTVLRYKEAIQAFKESVRINPDYAEAYRQLGVTYGRLDRHHEEIEAYKQFIHIKPDDADIHFGLGLAYLSIGNKDSALEEYKILKTLDKDLANELFNLIYR
ncbi:MAG: tetratricopeptide repeat protein [Planctomycetota bacterium]|jgi:tetratricopeptide (TPR) repeat protein